MQNVHQTWVELSLALEGFEGKNARCTSRGWRDLVILSNFFVVDGARLTPNHPGVPSRYLVKRKLENSAQYRAIFHGKC